MHPGWPHVRALLLAIHLFAITALALPSAGSGLNRTAWKNPTVQEEFAAWTKRLHKLGLTLDQQELEDVAFSFASGWNTLQQGIVTPFMPYFRHAGTYQSWRMFVAPHRFPARLHIDLDEGEGFHPIYVARSDTHTWRRMQLDQDRFRSAIFRYGWIQYQRAGHYAAFSKWVAYQAKQDFPKAIRVRTRFHVYRTASPEDVRAGVEPSGTFKAGKVHVLDRL